VNLQIPPHFTNIQHGLYMARKVPVGAGHAEPQIGPDYDGLPTAHFEGEVLHLL